MQRSTIQEISEIKYDTLGKQIQDLGRIVMKDLVMPLAQHLIPEVREFVEWIASHKDDLELLGMAIPAVVLTKSTNKVVKGFSGIAKTVGTATAEGAGFIGTLGRLTNPVGLAVTAVAGLATAYIAYKKHQEAARQALIHFEDSLQESSKAYDDANDQAQKVNELVYQYNHLEDAIRNNKSSGDKLNEQKKLQLDILQRLSDLYPNIISNYDIETGKAQERLGLVKQEADAQRDLMKLKLEQTVMEGKDKEDDLEKQISKLDASIKKRQQERDEYEKLLPVLQEYQIELEKASQIEDRDQQTKVKDAIREEINSLAPLGNNFSTNTLMESLLPDIINSLNKSDEKDLDTIIKQTEELSAAQDSYQAIYDSQKELLELNLGGTLEEQAAKFKTLSDTQKQAFVDALKKLQALNLEFQNIPIDKKINVDVLYKSSGIPQPAGTGTKPFIDLPIKPDLPGVPKVPYVSVTPNPPSKPNPPNLLPNLPNLPKYAEGGVATTPSIFGEAGPEIAVPAKPSQRSRDLAELAMRVTGAGSGGTIVFSPTINVRGTDGDAESQMQKALQPTFAQFKTMMAQYEQEQRRKSLR